MPAALVIHKNTMPHFFNAAELEALLKRLNALPEAPEIYLEHEAREWLASLQPPSGLYDSVTAAKVSYKNWSQARDARLLTAAMPALNMTARELAAALAYADSPPYGAPIRKVTTGHKAMSAGTRRLLAYVLKHGPMDQAEENKLLEALENGH